MRHEERWYAMFDRMREAEMARVERTDRLLEAEAPKRAVVDRLLEAAWRSRREPRARW